jgi:hypothetical protein
MNQQEAIEAAKRIGPEWRYVAMDNSLVWHAYKAKPTYDYEDGSWYTDDGMKEPIGHTPSSGEYSLSEVPQ